MVISTCVNLIFVYSTKVDFIICSSPFFASFLFLCFTVSLTIKRSCCGKWILIRALLNAFILDVAMSVPLNASMLMKILPS